MAADTQRFGVIARNTYRGVKVDVLEGHIHQFKATYLATPLPTNNRAFPLNYNANKIRADPSMRLSVSMRIFEAAGDVDGTGQLGAEVKKGVTGTQTEREGTVKVTGSYKLAPGVKGIIHAFHPKYPRTEDVAALDGALGKLRDTYDAVFKAAYDEENYEPDMTIALATLGAALPDWRSPQPQGTVIALTAIQKFIDTLIVVNDAQRKLPSQIAIILPPAEGDDVREDKRDEEFRLELQQHYIVELPKHLKNVAAPSPRRPPPPPRPPANKPAEKHAKPVVRSIVKPPRGAAGGIKPPVKPPVKPTPPQVVNKKFIPATPLPNAITSNVYKKILIQLCSGDIANFLPARSTRPPYACILVTDAAIELDGSGGPDDIAIHAAAGPLLQQALNDIKQTDDYSNTRTSVWTTGSFSLGYIRVRRIIHAVGPLYLGRASDASKSQKEVDLAATYRNVFEEAIKPENNAANMMVAFSFISLPRNNFPVDRGTEIALQAVVDFIDRGAIGGINHIMFVVQRDTDAAVDPFKNSLKTLIPGTGTGADKNTDTESDTSEDVATGPPIPSSSAPKPTSKKTKAQIAKEAKAKKDLAAKNKAKDAAKKAVHKAARDGDREEERRVDEARLRVQLLKVLTPRGPGSAEKQEEWLETQAEENKRRLKQYEKNMEQLKTETALRKKAEREKKAADKKTAGKKKTSKATTTGNTEKEPGSSSSSDTPLAQVAYETRAEASRKKAATEKAAQKKKTSTSRTNRTEPNPSSSSRKIPLAQVARETRAEAARKKAAPEKANADAAAKKTSSSKTPTPKVLALKRPAAILPPKKATAQTIGGVIVISGSGLNERLPSPSKISLPRETRSQKIARENGEKRGRDEAENVGGNPRPKRARTA